MDIPRPRLPRIIPTLTVLLGFAIAALWLRAPTFAFNHWNVDEAIHAATARILLEGGVLYRDAIDQRTPLTYYLESGILAIFGVNSLASVRVATALLIAATGACLFGAARNFNRSAAGVGAGLLFIALPTAAFSAGDANAASTEWSVAFFSSAAFAIFTSSPIPGTRRIAITGILLGLAFLSKQPAMLDLLAPSAAIAYTAYRRRITCKQAVCQVIALGIGWLLPTALFALHFIFNNAWSDAVFYSWTYNLAYYGPETSWLDRVIAALQGGGLLFSAAPIASAAWLVGSLFIILRVVQRQPSTCEEPPHPAWVYLCVWTLTTWVGAASSGRDFHHYFIPALATFAIGTAFSLSGMVYLYASRIWKIAATCIVLAAAWQPLSQALAHRDRTLPTDPSVRVSHYIRDHSQVDDTVFVWGYHPDIYVFSERRPASRFLYASFLTGLIPWTNVAPDRDTNYAIVPGAMETLLHDLERSAPRFIVDCSAGPNRHWEKYPVEKFPMLARYITAHYRPEAPGIFIPQGFRLYRRLGPSEAASVPASPSLTKDKIADFKLPVLGNPIQATDGSAPWGTEVRIQNGHKEYFLHAPSRLAFLLPHGGGMLRGGFGIRPAAYAENNPGPTDGAEFIINWRTESGQSYVLLRRFLDPRANEIDRGVQYFSVVIPVTDTNGGIVELEIQPGPAENFASDWTFWSDLMLENNQ